MGMVSVLPFQWAFQRRPNIKGKGGAASPNTSIPSIPGFDSQHSKNVSEKKIIDVVEVKEQRWWDESGHWLENVAWTHLVVASVKPLLLKCYLKRLPRQEGEPGIFRFLFIFSPNTSALNNSATTYAPNTHCYLKFEPRESFPLFSEMSGGYSSFFLTPKKALDVWDKIDGGQSYRGCSEFCWWRIFSGCSCWGWFTFTSPASEEEIESISKYPRNEQKDK